MFEKPTTYSYRLIKKSGGRVRLISEPVPELKERQRKLSRLLAREPAGDAVHGFRRGRSTASGAAEHVGRSVIVRIDLKNFFPSVTAPRVAGLFRSLGASPRRSWRLAMLCTCLRSGALPQGAPTSPVLANLVARHMDRRLGALALKLGWTFTRYADDLTFSRRGSDNGANLSQRRKAGSPAERKQYSGGTIPRGFRGDGTPDHRLDGSHEGGKDLREASKDLIHAVSRIVASEGFSVNAKKTRVMRTGSRQTVTGIVVNDKLALKRDDVRQLRAILHNAERTGLDAQNRLGIAHWTDYLRGKLGLLHMVSPEKATPLTAQFERLNQRNASK